MYAAVLFALVAAFSPNPAQQDRDPKLGKSDAEIVALGREAWGDLYAREVGGSTAAMAQAEDVFGEAHTRVNDLALAKLPAARQASVKAVRAAGRDVGNGLVSLGAAFSGGGTMWIPVEAAVPATVEALVARLAKTPGAANAKKADQGWASARNVLDRLAKKIEADRKDLEEMSLGDQTSYARARAAHRTTSQAVAKLRAAAAKLPGDGPMLVAAWCTARLRVTLEEAP